MNISLAAEPVTTVIGIPITNSMLTAVGVALLLMIAGLLVRLVMALVPSKGQSAFELLYDYLVGTAETVTGNPRVARDLFPFIVTAFLFIVISNWSGLIPGFNTIGFERSGELIPLFRAPTADLNMVIALALISVSYVQYLAIKYRGAKDYLHTFFNFSSPIYFFVGIIELISEFTRIISYSFRLFGNVFAGEVLISVLLYLTSTLAPVLPILPLPFYFLEMFVGAIQGLVFCFLTIVFAGIATAHHGDSHDHVAEPAKSVVSPAV